MSDFLEDWDLALRSARAHGEVVWLRQFTVRVDEGVVLYPQTTKEFYDDGEVPFKWSGRTMHPSFMATPMPKHDPDRDGNKPSIQQERDK
jgi:hypothetical protein